MGKDFKINKTHKIIAAFILITIVSFLVWGCGNAKNNEVKTNDTTKVDSLKVDSVKVDTLK